MDTLVSSCPLLPAEFFSKCSGRNIAEARVAPLAVVKALDVFLYSGLCIGPGGVTLMMYQLVLEASPEAFHRGVVIAVSPARHGCLHAKLFNQFLSTMSAILAAVVRVVNQSWRRALVMHGSPQHRCGQALRHPLAHRIANQLAGKKSLMPPGRAFLYRWRHTCCQLLKPFSGGSTKRFDSTDFPPQAGHDSSS